MCETQRVDANNDATKTDGNEHCSDDNVYYIKGSVPICESKKETTLKIIALLFLRSVKRAEEFYIAANIKGPTLFSDIFFKYVCNEGNVKSWLFHVNCSEKTSVNVNLISPKYQTSLTELCCNINSVKNNGLGFSETFEKLCSFNDFEFILYTPSHISESDFFKSVKSCSWPYTLLNSGNKENVILSYLDQSDHDIKRTLEDLKKYKQFLLEMKDIGSNDEIINKIAALEILIENKEIIAKLKYLGEETSGEVIETLIGEAEIIDLAPYLELLPSLKFFSQQANKDSLVVLIKNEIKNLADLCNFSIKLLYKYLMQKLQTWWESENYCLTKDCFIWEEFKSKLHCLANIPRPHLYSVINAGLTFFAFPTKEIKSAITQNRFVSVFASSSDMSLTCLKVCQVLEILFPQKFIWITFDTLVNQREDVLEIWPSRNVSVLIVECKTDCTDCDIVSNELAHLLLSCRDNKLIVISKENNNFSSSLKNKLRKGYGEVKDTFKFIDLDDQSQTNILNKEVLFQGYLVSVEYLIGSYPQLRECLDASVVSQLIETNSPFVIGPTLHNKVSNFIPRTLELLIDIDINILASRVQTEIFFVSNATPSKLKQILKIDNVELISSDAPIIFTDCFVFCFALADASCIFHVLCEQFPSKNLHHFLFANCILQWKESKGEIKYLKDFICTEKMSKKASHVLEVIENNKISTHNPETLLDTLENPAIVVGDSGIGKSTLLLELMSQTKLKDPMNWLIYLNCSEHVKFFSETKKEDYSYEVVMNMMCSLLEKDDHNISSIERAVLRHSLVTRGNTIVICDGLDDVRSDVLEKIVHFLLILKDMNVRKLWIASSLCMKSFLQRSFEVVLYELLPFTSENQKSFFLSNLKYTTSQNHCDRIENFISALQKVCKPNKGKKKSLLTIPLFCLMACEIFEGELREYLSTGTVHWPEDFDIAQMYDRYINLKRECSQTNNPDSKEEITNDKDLEEAFVNRHMICALLSLYDVDDLAKLNLQDIPENISKLIPYVEKFGIIIGVLKGKPVFSHRSIAEYFAALWFSRNIEKCRDFLKYRVFSSNFAAVMKFFDYILIRGYELHSAVLNDDFETIENLVAYGVDINATDKAGRSALHLAVIHNKRMPLVPSAPDSESETHNPVLRVLVSHSINTKMIDNVLFWRPIQYAIELRKWDAIDLLLKEQVDFNDLDCLKEKISDRQFVQEGLRVASEEGYFNLIECFSCCGINITDNIIEWQDGLYNPLHIAARYGRQKLVRYLLSKKIKIAIKTSRGITPLHFAACEGMAHVVTYLLQRGADLHCVDKEGNVPLSYAIFRGDIQMVILLVEQYSCNINIQNRYGDSPLHHAVRVGHLTMVEYFLMKGAQINACNKEGNTPLHTAVWLGALPVLKILLEYGADVNFKNKYGETPLSQNAGGGNLQIVQTLIENGADINIRAEDGNTVMHWAARQDNINVLEFLVSIGGDMNVQNRYGNTPLHRAIEHGSVNASKFLIQSGCNVKLLNKAGYSPSNMKSRSKEAENLFDS